MLDIIIAIPVVLYAALAILRSLLPAPSPPNLQSKHRIFVSKTRHARIKPVGHSFTYPTLYVAVDLDQLQIRAVSGLPRGWVNHNTFGLFSIHDVDFLVEPASSNAGRIIRAHQGSILWSASAPHQSVKDKLMSFLAKMGVDVQSIGGTYLATTPRLLNYVFNPLNVYYCYNVDTPDSLVCVLLEVNNTFGERHIYLCDYRNQLPKSPSGYISSHMLTRAFHVFPFNNRSGGYEAHIGSLHKHHFDILLNLVKYDKQDAKHMTARVHGDGVELTAYSAFHSWIQVGLFTVFLTVPRIMWQAWKLAYMKRLGVYGRPNPKVHGGSNVSQTIIHQEPTTFECFAMELVMNHLELLGLPLNLHLPDSANTIISLSPVTTNDYKAPSPAIDVHIHSFTFFTAWLCDVTNTSRALLSSFVRGDFACSDLAAFLSMLKDRAPRNRESGSDNLKSHGSRLEAVVRTLLSWLHPYHADMDASTPIAAHLKPLDWAGITLRQGYSVVKEATMARFEAYYFDATTKFAWSPFQLEARMRRYAKELEAGLLESGLSLDEDESSPGRRFVDSLDSVC
ncbi:hypothetical protein SeMB42_g03722 [Synchytrium endobioticum]|uniref:Uncharacterized protein n=1 Tax=Synchytrium endobioticum TaxID=286115 RepID=A0A507D4G7_9FUNG|nr:hypothetical protein SeMB42_g03722 [Synchytrium endobioticum]